VFGSDALGGEDDVEAHPASRAVDDAATGRRRADRLPFVRLQRSSVERTAVIALGPAAEDCRTLGTAAGHPSERLRLAATVTSTGSKAAGRG
jgi:hypothetical protein